MKTLSLVLFPIVSILMLWNTPAFAVEVAPRISDREIVESLTEVRGDIKGLGERLDAVDKGLNKRIDDLRSEIKGDIKGLEGRLDAVDKGLNKRIDDLRDGLRSEMNGRFEEVNHRFDTLQWTLGLFITIALVILGFVLRMQWQMHRRQTRMETVLETQRDELSFIRGIIEKLLPPRGVL